MNFESSIQPNAAGADNPGFIASFAYPHAKLDDGIFCLSRLPEENPNPVMRIDNRGILLYANPASQRVLQYWGVLTGCSLPNDLLESAYSCRDRESNDEIEMTCGDKVFAFRVSSPKSRNYINLYGHEITIRKQAQKARLEHSMRQAKLLRASTKILAQTDLDDLLQVISDTACSITRGKIGAAGHGLVNGKLRINRSSGIKNHACCTEGAVFFLDRGGVHMEVLQRVHSLRLTDEQLRSHPAWWGLPEGHVPLHGLLAARMVGRDGAPNGIIMVTQKESGQFTADDEAALRQLAAIASLALQNLEARTEAEERARQAIEHEKDLARSNKELEQFAYIASHDLQEPLRTIRSYLQLIERRYNDLLDPEGREFIRFTSDGAARLQNLVQDLLTYSRVSTRAKPMAMMPAEKALREALASLKQAIAETNAHISFDPLPTVNADEVQLSRVFQNLIANAIKFHRPNVPPRIRISAQEQDAEWLFTVADNGIGIDPKYFERIFIVFQRLHTHNQYPGSGVGLTICKRIVERHCGRIWVESKPDHGSAFFFTLPKPT